MQAHVKIVVKNFLIKLSDKSLVLINKMLSHRVNIDSKPDCQLEECNVRQVIRQFCFGFLPNTSLVPAYLLRSITCSICPKVALITRLVEKLGEMQQSMQILYVTSLSPIKQAQMEFFLTNSI